MSKDAVKEPKVVPLKRAPLLTEDQVGRNLRAQLASKAEMLLGYTTLKENVRVAGELGKVLLELDIEPFTKDSVERYKKSKMTKITYRRNWTNVTETRKWTRHPISGYSKPIPEFVLNKAVQIKEKLPDVQFLIDELGTVRRLKKIQPPDPFLVAVLGNEEYYIEVWDEPKFEGRIRRNG